MGFFFFSVNSTNFPSFFEGKNHKIFLYHKFGKEEDDIDIMNTLIITENMHHNIILAKMWVHNAQIIVSTRIHTNVASRLAEAIMGLKMAFVGRGTMSHFNVIVPCRWDFFFS